VKIFCIGRNYAEHAAELNNPTPTFPLIFMKPSTALLSDNKPFYHPEFSENIHYEVELVLKISKNGKAIQKQFANQYYEEIALGIDFTARDVQDKLKEKGHPWEISKGFDQSACLSKFIKIEEFPSEDNINFKLYKNETLAQNGNSKDMLFPFDNIIVELSKYFTLQKGDLIYTGTPAGVGKIVVGDMLRGELEGQTMFSCQIK
jgi:acylpyruvate hydrolase